MKNKEIVPYFPSVNELNIDHPACRHLSNPYFHPKDDWYPISDVQIPSGESYRNHDGSKAETQSDGIIKRSVRKMSGQVGYQYLTTDRYVITDVEKYRSMKKEHAKRIQAQKIVATHAEMESTGQPAQSYGPARDRHSRPEPNIDERIDDEIDRAIRQNDMIDLADAFPDIGLSDDPTSPAERARVANLHSNKYQREYILRTVHRMTLRRMPTDQIAKLFNVAVDTVYKWIQELRERLKKEATTINLYSVAGDSLAFYDEIRAMGMTIAQEAPNKKIKDRIRGMEVALKSEADKHRFLTAAGFYDSARLGRDVLDDTHTKNASKLIDMVQNTLSGNFEPAQDSDDSDDDDQNILL